MQVNSLLLRVVAISESYGVRFPRCEPCSSRLLSAMHALSAAPAFLSQAQLDAFSTVCREFGLLLKQILYLDRCVLNFAV